MKNIRTTLNCYVCGESLTFESQIRLSFGQWQVQDLQSRSVAAGWDEVRNSEYDHHNGGFSFHICPKCSQVLSDLRQKNRGGKRENDVQLSRPSVVIEETWLCDGTGCDNSVKVQIDPIRVGNSTKNAWTEVGTEHKQHLCPACTKQVLKQPE